MQSGGLEADTIFRSSSQASQGLGVRCIGVTLLAILIASCRSNGPAAIGSAYASGPRETTVLNVVQDAMDSLPTRRPVVMRPWSLSRFGVTGHVDQAELFANDPGVVAVVGHSGSRDALLGASTYNAAGVPQVVPTATSRRLARMGPWTFMMVPDDSAEGDYLAAWTLDTARATRVAVMYVGDEYGIGLRDGVRFGLTARGTPPVDEVMVPAQGCTPTPARVSAFEAIVRAMLARARPDAIVVATGVASAWCVVRYVHAHDPGVWIISADGGEIGARVPAGLSFDTSRVRGVGYRIDAADSLVADFLRRFERIVGRPPTAGEALQFDAFLLVRHAIDEVGANRAAVRDYLASLGRSRTPWRGVTGSVQFSTPRTELFRMDAPGRPTRAP